MAVVVEIVEMFSYQNNEAKYSKQESQYNKYIK